MLFLVGGGRAIDEGKEIATIPRFILTFPTLASNCAPVKRRTKTNQDSLCLVVTVGVYHKHLFQN